MSRNGNGQAACLGNDAVPRYDFAQTFDGAVDPLLRGVLGGFEDFCHFADALVLEVAEQERIAVVLAQVRKGGVKLRRDSFP